MWRRYNRISRVDNQPSDINTAGQSSQPIDNRDSSDMIETFDICLYHHKKLNNPTPVDCRKKKLSFSIGLTVFLLCGFSPYWENKISFSTYYFFVLLFLLLGCRIIFIIMSAVDWFLFSEKILCFVFDCIFDPMLFFGYTLLIVLFNCRYFYYFLFLSIIKQVLTERPFFSI